jgi:hypothetical protein
MDCKRSAAGILRQFTEHDGTGGKGMTQSLDKAFIIYRKGNFLIHDRNLLQSRLTTVDKLKTLQSGKELHQNRKNPLASHAGWGDMDLVYRVAFFLESFPESFDVSVFENHFVQIFDLKLALKPFVATHVRGVVQPFVLLLDLLGSTVTKQQTRK